MWRKVRSWVLDRIGRRDELRSYLGYGDFDVERGWWVGRRWFSYDK